jgi:DNA helicase II / ATP-dependent DNA helicase PcrA
VVSVPNVTDLTVSSFPGPAALGRGIVVRPGQQLPAGWDDKPRLHLDDATLRNPDDTLQQLRRWWAARVPSVVELAIDPHQLKEPETDPRTPRELGVSFSLPREQLRLLVWSNRYDLRDGQPRWWHNHRAGMLGAEPSSVADVTVRGRPTWIDGGPRAPLAPAGTGNHQLIHAETLEISSLQPDMAPTGTSAALAPDQRAAVTHPSGPARIVAPAGSGKTRVLTERLRHLLADRKLPATQTTCLAYNKRAAEEMRSRTTDLTNPQIRTLHALGYEIVRTARPGVALIDEREVRRRLEPLVPLMPRPNVDIYAPYIDALGAARLGLRDPRSIEQAAPDDLRGFADVYQRYRDALIADNRIDFDEQIHSAIEILATRPDLRRTYQAQCRQLLVDEFQDLNPALVLLIRILAAPGWQVFGVGDDDQVIYAYAGATPDFLINYDRLFGPSAHYALEVNYRCPPEVVTAASTLLGHNQQRIPKTIIPAPDRTPSGGTLTVERVPSEDMTATALGSIRARLDDGAGAGDIAVLCRVNAMLLPVQVALLEAGLPTTLPVGPEVLKRTGLAAALAWLRLATAPESELAGKDLDTVLRRSPRKVTRDTLDRLKGRRSWKTQQIKQFAFKDLEVWEGKELRGFLDDLAAVGQAARRSTSAALTTIRNVGGLDQAVNALDSSADTKRSSSHLDDLLALAQLAASHPDATSFEEWLQSLLSRRDQPAGDAIQLSTIHTVKGLEFDHVILYGANGGLMPHRLATDEEEERRIFHVAVTRCRKTITVLADRKAPSPFLEQLVTPYRPPDAKPPRARRQPQAATGRTRAPRAQAPRANSARRASPRAASAIRATLGLTISFSGGPKGEIIAMDRSGVTIQTSSGAKLKIRFGTLVTSDGARGELVQP